MPPTVSVVIPVLFDADAAAGLLSGLPPSADVELIVVDGADDLRLDSIVAAHGSVILRRTSAGRGRQMNAGAETASGEWLLFLHADSTLPAGWLPALAQLGADNKVIGGWFRFALDDSAWQARVIERLTAWRVRHFQLPYGDQGLFVRRDTFRKLGGFQELPLMEDVEFVRRLVASGAVVEVPLPLRTSARRWRADGWFRRSATNLLLVLMYFAGVPPERLARWYRSGLRK